MRRRPALRRAPADRDVALAEDGVACRAANPVALGKSSRRVSSVSSTLRARVWWKADSLVLGAPLLRLPVT
jgi:hypothetical protein